MQHHKAKKKEIEKKVNPRQQGSKYWFLFDAGKKNYNMAKGGSSCVLKWDWWNHTTIIHWFRRFPPNNRPPPTTSTTFASLFLSLSQAHTTYAHSYFISASPPLFFSLFLFLPLWLAHFWVLLHSRCPPILNVFFFFFTRLLDIHSQE